MSGANITNLIVGIIVLALFLSLQLAITLAVQRYLLITRATRREAAGQLTGDGPRSSAPARP